MSKLPIERIYAQAYELKAGGFRGIAAQMSFNNKLVGEILKSEVCPDLNTAKRCAWHLSQRLISGRAVTSGPYRTKARNEWKCNYFFGRGGGAAV